MAAHRRRTAKAHLSRRMPMMLPALGLAAGVGVVAGLATSTPPAATPAHPALVGAQSAGPEGPTARVVGQVVDMTPDSITTRASDGTTMTFRLTPATSQVGTGFAPNQTVTVISTHTGGTPVARAVVDEASAAHAGPPMDGDSGA